MKYNKKLLHVFADSDWFINDVSRVMINGLTVDITDSQWIEDGKGYINDQLWTLIHDFSADFELFINTAYALNCKELAYFTNKFVASIKKLYNKKKRSTRDFVSMNYCYTAMLNSYFTLKSSILYGIPMYPDTNDVYSNDSKSYCEFFNFVRHANVSYSLTKDSFIRGKHSVHGGDYVKNK